MCNMEQCNRCCVVCCFSTPYATIFTLSITLVGLVGFLSSSVYSVILVSETPLFENNTVVLAPIVGGVAGTTLIPLLVATILAYCVTGYVRDELYHPLITKCVSGPCNILVVLWVFVYFMLWLLITVALGMITALYLQLEWGCSKFPTPAEGENPAVEQCFTYAINNSSATSLEFCQTGLDDLCTQGKRIGLSLSISAAFSLVIVVGFVAMMIVQAANYISARESSKRSYRPGGDY